MLNLSHNPLCLLWKVCLSLTRHAQKGEAALNPGRLRMSKVARAARTATEVRQEAVTVGAAAVVMCDKKGNAALIRTSMPHGKMSRSWLAFTLVRVPLMFAKER